MKILVLGATGYLGSAITDHLLELDHQVVAVQRASDRVDARTQVRHGDLAVPSSLSAAVTPDIDAVVHAAAPLGDWRAERAAVRAMIDRLGPDKVFLYLSGTWVLGARGASDGRTRAFDETAAPNPIALVRGRETVEDLVRRSPVTGVVLRPGIGYGRGGGIPRLLVELARQHGQGRVVGDASTTWPMVHVDDLARLAELAIRTAAPRDVLHGVAHSAVPVGEVAAAADVVAGGTGVATAWDLGEAAQQLGADFAEALATSQAVRAERAGELGWAPLQPDAITELTRGSYVLEPAGGEPA
jgi:nucleoside-diphosphate-sugar epimerase